MLFFITTPIVLKKRVYFLWKACLPLLLKGREAKTYKMRLGFERTTFSEINLTTKLPNSIAETERKSISF